MRYLTSRSFVVGVVLAIAGTVATPLFVTALTEQDCTTPSPTNPSWDCVHPMIVDFRIPMLMLGTGLVLILAAIVRMRRGNRERRQ